MQRAGHIGIAVERPLGNGLDRPRRQSLDRIRCAIGGKTAENKNGDRSFGHDGPRGFDAIHQRHPQIHDHHIGGQFARHFHRLESRSRLAHHLNGGIVAHLLNDDLAGDNIVIHHKQTNTAVHLFPQAERTGGKMITHPTRPP